MQPLLESGESIVDADGHVREEANMAASDGLQGFVVWAKQQYPAKRYFLDSWGHLRS
jgi:hypothetical protein